MGTDDDDRRQKAAVVIQCLWRRISAMRRVTNIKLWRWVTRRNAIRIQCLFRSRVARGVRQELEAHRALRRTLLERNVAARKHAALVELIQWRGERCNEAALAIQKWYRQVQQGEAPGQQSSLMKVIKEAKKRRAMIEAEQDANKLDGSLSESPKLGKSGAARSVRVNEG
jgi:hypothetical protein